MTKAYKEDPHWFGVTGCLKGVGGHWWAELEIESMSECWPTSSMRPVHLP